MYSAKELEQEVYELLQEYVATSEHVNYCGNCPLLTHDDDTDAYDCEYGGDIEGCEYSPSVELQRIATSVWEAVMNCKP